jgi:hypothetical protein
MKTANGQTIIKEAGGNKYKCRCCLREFLYSYDALTHFCGFEPLIDPFTNNNKDYEGGVNYSDKRHDIE